MRIHIVHAFVVASVATMGCAVKQAEPADLEAELEARKSPILAEIAALGPDHPWAGEYSTGPDFMGTAMLIAPCSGCLAFDWGCLGAFNMDWGSVSVRDGRVYVAFEKRGYGTSPRDFEQEYTVEGTGAGRCLMPVRNDAYGERLCLYQRSR